MPDDGEYESGPYCQHWSEPWDCEDPCVCGHPCKRHDIHDRDCRERSCSCKKFEDKVNP